MDVIGRREAIEQLHQSYNLLDAERRLEDMPSAQPDNQIHLCDSCEYDYPECPCKQNDVIFGNGKGNDNICACNKYRPSAQPEPCDDPRADVYYLAEKIGIHRLYALVVELRGEPEPCEDAVSRQAAIDAIESTRWYHIDKNGELAFGANSKTDVPLFKAEDIFKVIKAIPSAQPERKNGYRDGYKRGKRAGYKKGRERNRGRGEWTEKNVIYEDEADRIFETWQTARCSNCGKYHTTPYLYYFDNYNYCPNCGARMEEGEEDE